MKYVTEESRIKFRSIGGHIVLVDSSYNSATLYLASEMLVKETLALMVDRKVILINDENVDYYTIVAKKGLSWLGAMAAKAFTGTIGYSLARSRAGGLGTEKLIFVKLVDGNYILLQVEEGYMHLIRSKRKIAQNKLSKKESHLIDSVIDDLLSEEGTSREELAKESIPTFPEDEQDYEDEDDDML